MKNLPIYALAIFAVLIFAGIDAYACSCIPVNPDEPIARQVSSAKKDSAVVFSGKVLEIVRKPEDFQIIVKFQTQSSWKGSVSKQITITTASDSAMCGYNFEVGKIYLVYASGANAKSLQTGICTRTAELKAAKADVKALGKAKILRRK